LRRQDDPASAADLATPRGDKSDCGSVAGDSVKLSLDQYLNTATSEDNQSFVEIMEEADLKHKQKVSFLIQALSQLGSKKPFYSFRSLCSRYRYWLIAFE
jgi:hypothetical protein